jgi:ribosomal protein L13
MPEMIIKIAVNKMLPKNRLRKGRMTRLLCFRGPTHDFPDIFKEHQVTRMCV